ncbi:MAG: metalloregulator ArsR/SmtB family transcription factor [Pseudomonadales bacterium]|nr:metalloregulator ArsR/SmtB family transcription factor [Pseudomonadales bacterium]
MKISPNEMAAQADNAELFLKQIANNNRLMVLCVLVEGERSVGELNELVPISQSALSQHLAKLRDAGFVSTRRESQTIYYQLADPRVKVLLDSLYSMFCTP